MSEPNVGATTTTGAVWLCGWKEQIKLRALPNSAGDACVPANAAHKGAHLRNTQSGSLLTFGCKKGRKMF